MAYSPSLNPYSNGMKIERDISRQVSRTWTCLNPYSNGMKIEHKPEIKNGLVTSS